MEEERGGRGSVCVSYGCNIQIDEFQISHLTLTLKICSFLRRTTQCGIRVENSFFLLKQLTIYSKVKALFIEK